MCSSDLERARIVAVDARRRLQRAIRVDMNKRIEGGLELLDAFERRRHQLGRADLPRMNERGQLTGRREEKILRHGSPQPTGASVTLAQPTATPA